MESPTKKQYYQPSAVPSYIEPDDLRGSHALRARVDEELANRIRERSMSSRRAVAQGYELPPNAPGRRTLTVTQSLPAFFPTHSGSYAFSSSNIMAEVHDDYERQNELLPFGASPSGSRTSSFRSGVLGGGGPIPGEEGQGTDGFDMDEVFGSSSSKLLFGASAFTRFEGGGDDSQESNTTTKLSGGTKRTLEDDPFNNNNNNNMQDEEMELEKTDVEDEGEDDVGALPSTTGARIIVGRRNFTKTVSLPNFGFGALEKEDGW